MTQEEIQNKLSEARKAQKVTFAQLVAEGWQDKTAQNIFKKIETVTFKNILKMAERLNIEIKAEEKQNVQI